jgi:tripartite-type tricarboxylate transporter receptor subunit TctC
MRVAVALCAFIATSAFGQTYPARSIRLIVPYGAGGSADIAARLIAPRLAESLGQQVVVDNRPGAGTIIGTELLAKSPPDGHTLMLANVSFGAVPALHRKLPYDPANDFAAVSLVDVAPQLLLVHPSLPVRKISDLVALAKSKPGQINYSSAGIGSGNHLNAELFRSETGISIVHVPYQSGAQALTALLTGEAQIDFAGIAAALPYINRVRILAVTSPKRVSGFPEVPTVAETVAPGFEFYEWHGIITRAGTPGETIAVLNREINKAVLVPEVRERIAAFGADAIGSTPQQMTDRIRAEMARWKNALKPIN